jgi:hypothetical protein
MTSSESSGAGCLFHPGLGCSRDAQRADRLRVLAWGAVHVDESAPRPAIRVDVAERPDLRDLRRVLMSDTARGQASSHAVWHYMQDRSLVLVTVITEPVRAHYSIVFPESDRSNLETASWGRWLGLVSAEFDLLTWLDTVGMRDALAKVAALEAR